MITLLFGVLIMLMGCTPKPIQKAETITDTNLTIYYGGDIITMNAQQLEYVEAVVQSGDKIVFVGNKDEAVRKYTTAKTIDLKGKTLMPGFIEPHLHPSLAAIMLQNEIIAPYDWKIPSGIKKGVSGHEVYLQRLSESIKANATKDKIYFVWGYHQLWHGELNKEILNKIAGDQPVAIIHRSFHEIFLNDAGLEFIKVPKEKYENHPQIDWEKGHFFEGGFMDIVPLLAPILLEPKSYLAGLSSMSILLKQNGITTIAEPGFPNSNFEGELKLLQIEMSKQPTYDVYLIPNGTQLYKMKGGNEEALNFIKTLDTNTTYNTPNIHFLPMQVKLFSDGAIYSQLMQMKDGYTDGHHGEWMTPLDLLQKQIHLYWTLGYKIHMHSNGDLGQQEVIDYVKNEQEKYPRKDHRFTLHHMGYFTKDMAKEMVDLGIEASVNPYYLWALADKYSEFGLGKERAENLVAIKNLTDLNIPVSFHSDFSMAPVEPLTLAWTAINRVTSQNNAFSQDQRVSVYDGMKAITISAARTLNLENEIGSIAVGKRANFTILKENPFKINPLKIKDIAIEGIVYRGDIFYNE